MKVRHKKMARAARRSSEKWDYLEFRLTYLELYEAVRRNDRWHSQFKSLR